MHKSHGRSAQTSNLLQYFLGNLLAHCMFCNLILRGTNCYEL